MSSKENPPSLSMMDLTISKALSCGKLLTSYLTDLGLISTSLASPCKMDLELLCCCNLCSNCGFAVPAGT